MKKYDYKVEGDVFYFNYLEMASTVEEAQEQANFVRSQLSKPAISKFLNDNRNITAVAAPEVGAVWGELMGWVSTNVEKNATIAPNTSLKMQLNRLSKTAGTYESVRAFTDVQQALEFVGVPSLELS
ncbi:hypothetical protein [Alkalicoccobacillus porphyridii]|uniref:Uncharacterized protein n=1 Tax=Alkalicoccobacillus porphyridii TaxID=2597270 RepID=A0A554A1D4_9BACI|nr:hypothetical protein [Alkalicoccobacillus porphyridii]TSB47493.1 hypothetical protein FN960_07085 [Alkalicoccobacillus porphyridii]